MTNDESEATQAQHRSFIEFVQAFRKEESRQGYEEEPKRQRSYNPPVVVLSVSLISSCEAEQSHSTGAKLMNERTFPDFSSIVRQHGDGNRGCHTVNGADCRSADSEKIGTGKRICLHWRFHACATKAHCTLLYTIPQNGVIV